MSTNQFVVSFKHPKSGHQEWVFDCPIRAVQIARLIQSRWGRPTTIDQYGPLDDERAKQLNRKRVEHASQRPVLRSVMLRLAAVG